MAESGRPRIGLVIGQLTYGGAEGQLYELARGLQADCDVFVYCLSASDVPYGDRLRSAGIPVRVLASSGHLDLRRAVALAKALRGDRIDVAHAFLFIASAYVYAAFVVAAWSGSGLEAAFVASARNCKPEPSALRRWLLRRAFRRADAVLCNSQEMARFAVAYYGAVQKRVRVVYNGVDTERFSVAPRPRPKAEQALEVGTIGRLEKQKNLAMFLQAAALVRRQRPEARFTIVGTGSLREELEREIDTLGLGDAVTLTGTTDDVAAVLAGWDQFWLTSDWEGTPNVVLEAMAAGLPVLATRVGGTAELLSAPGAGCLVEAGHAAAVADRCLKIAAAPDQGQSIGDAARADVAARFSLQAMVGATSEIYGAVGRG